MTDIWVSDHGLVLQDVHPETACEGRGCCLHHPSDHHMKTWRLNWRGDHGLMERICPHGIGHVDPDDLAYRMSTFHSDADVSRWSQHGCDGCCAAEEAA